MAKSNGKPRVAFFDFTSCEGCQLTVVDTLQTHPELLNVIEIVEFREASSARSDDYQIAFIEGSCTRPSDESRLKAIRETADTVIALGACAHLGGINAIRNNQQLAGVRSYVYGDQANLYDTYEPRAISQVIDVNYVIPGCPIDRNEFVRLVTMLLQGREPYIPAHPMCIECKMRENVCVYTKGQVCLGPITLGGCNAICPAFGYGCEGCRGLVPNPNLDSLQEILVEHGLNMADVESKMALFLTNQVLQEAPIVGEFAGVELAEPEFESGLSLFLKPRAMAIKPAKEKQNNG